MVPYLVGPLSLASDQRVRIQGFPYSGLFLAIYGLRVSQADVASVE